jgi:hypothetical protein
MARRKLRIPKKQAPPDRRRSKDTPPTDPAKLASWLLTCRHLLMPAEVAKILRLKQSKVYNLPITRIQLSPRRTRFEAESLHRYVVSKATRSMSNDDFVSFCTAFGMQGGLMNSRDLGRFLRVPARDAELLDIPVAPGTGATKAWDRAQVAAWLWAHGRAPGHD